MESTLKQFLLNHYVEDREQLYFTHTSMIQPKGKYHMDVHSLENFWPMYCDAIHSDSGTIIGLTEKPQSYLPVLADIDIKVENADLSSCDEHLYTEEQLKLTVECYRSVLCHILDEYTEENLMCVVLEKPMYEQNKYTKSGFHLHFPNTFMSKVNQETHLIPRLKDLFKSKNVFENLGIEDYSKIIDNGYIKSPWLLYGSRKSEDMDTYTVTKILNHNGEEISLEEAFDSYKLFNSDEKRMKVRGRVEYLLPRLLSILPANREECDVKLGLESPLKKEIKKQTVKKNTHLKVSVEEALQIATILLPMLADSRAENYYQWMNIGWILYNIGEGSGQAFELWSDFSKRSEKFDDARCVYEWKKMVVKSYTLGTLKHYASVDSPDEYSEYKQSISNKCVQDSLNGSHNAIAKILLVNYSNEFKCASYLSNMWYQFKDHKWEEIEDGIFLRERLSTEITDKFKNIAKKEFQNLETAVDVDEVSCNSKIKQAHKIITQLGSSPYKSNVMKEAKELFYDRSFKDKLDQDPYIIAFKNGIYDLKQNTFRDGCPEDYVSKSLPFDYNPNFTEGDDTIRDVEQFLEQIFPDTSLRKYFLDVYSDIFVGGNSMKKIFIWSGSGDNGKSVMQTLFDKMLGELGVKFDTKMFSGKKCGAGAASPEMSRASPPVRLVTADEPDNNETFHTGLLKSLSGNDSFWARDLYERGKGTREVVPMFMLNIICNKLPGLDNPDTAIFNRLRVISFETTFVDASEDCPETHAEQLRQKRFPKDEKFSEKIPSMVPAFAWYLLQHRQKVSIRIEPEKVKQATAQYQKRNDTYRQFTEECIIEDEDKTLTLAELWDQFKSWYKEGFSHPLSQSKEDIRVYFAKMWEKHLIRNDKWQGFRIKTFADDEDFNTDLNKPNL